MQKRTQMRRSHGEFDEALLAALRLGDANDADDADEDDEDDEEVKDEDKADDDADGGGKRSRSTGNGRAHSPAGSAATALDALHCRKLLNVVASVSSSSGRHSNLAPLACLI